MLSPDNGVCNEQYLLISGTIWPMGFGRLCGINPGTYMIRIFLISINLLNTYNFRSTFLHPFE